jgi:hypothetical protein
MIWPRLSVPVLSFVPGQPTDATPTHQLHKPTKQRNQPTQPETNMRYVGNDIYPAPQQQQGWLFPEGPSHTFKANKHLQLQYPIARSCASASEKKFPCSAAQQFSFFWGGVNQPFSIPLTTKPPSVRPLEKSDLGDQSTQKWNMQQAAERDSRGIDWRRGRCEVWDISVIAKQHEWREAVEMWMRWLVPDLDHTSRTLETKQKK